MRIAMVSDFYLDYVGGAQTSMTQQRIALQDAGHVVRMVRSVRKQQLPDRRLSRRDDVGLAIRPSYTLPGLELPVRAADAKLVAALRDYFVQERIEVVHVQTEFGLAHAATTAARAIGLPVVSTIHTFYWQSTTPFAPLIMPIASPALQVTMRTRFPRVKLTDRPTDNLVRNLTLALAYRVDVVVSPSAHQAADLAAAGVRAPIEVVPNPIAGAERPAAVLTAAQAADPSLLWVARCEPEKRPIPFVHGVIAALQRGATFRTHIVGDGAELGALRDLAAAHASITVHGALPHDAVVELMDQSALVALTSYGFDNQPMTIAEASSRYRGVLYCDPNLREGLTHSGYLTRDPEPPAIADAIVELTGDPSRLIALSKGAVRDSATFSASGFVERILGVYTEAIALAG